MKRKKEIAKFFAGVTAWEAVVHTWLYVAGHLPIEMFGITVTPMINTFQIIIQSALSIFLVYYAWIKK